MDTHASGRADLIKQLIARSRERAKERQHAQALRRVAMQHVGLDPEHDDPPTMVVPAQRDGIAEVTPERRRRLRRHIARLLRNMSTPAEVPAASETWMAPPTPLGLAACTMCQGRCCGHGGDLAYLTELTMARVVAAEANPSASRLLRRYLQRVPDKAVRGSCIFHGERGCTLDRPLRADICNRYYCAPVRGFFRTAAAREGRDVLVTAVQDGVLHDVCMVKGTTSA